MCCCAAAEKEKKRTIKVHVSVGDEPLGVCTCSYVGVGDDARAAGGAWLSHLVAGAVHAHVHIKLPLIIQADFVAQARTPTAVACHAERCDRRNRR